MPHSLFPWPLKSGLLYLAQPRHCSPQLGAFLLPLPPPETFLPSIQALPRQTSNWSASVLQKLGIPNLMAQEVPNLPLDYYTCPFKANKLCW